MKTIHLTDKQFEALKEALNDYLEAFSESPYKRPEDYNTPEEVEEAKEFFRQLDLVKDILSL